jgi:hypothetical protein
MTVLEMHTAVKLGLDKTSSLALPGFEPEEIDYWLNEAQLELVKQKMFGNNYRQENFDMGVKRADDLSILMTYSSELTYNVSNTTPNFRPHSYHPNVATVNIEASTMPDYLFYIGADLLINDPHSHNPGVQPAETIRIPQEDIGVYVETPFNRPILRNGYIYLKEGEVNVIYDPEATPVSIYVSYLKRPATLDISTPAQESDLPEQVHSEIVALTVKLMIENIESPRVETNEFELSRKE